MTFFFSRHILSLHPIITLALVITKELRKTSIWFSIRALSITTDSGNSLCRAHGPAILFGHPCHLLPALAHCPDGGHSVHSHLRKSSPNRDDWSSLRHRGCWCLGPACRSGHSPAHPRRTPWSIHDLWWEATPPLGSGVKVKEFEAVVNWPLL